MQKPSTLCKNRDSPHKYEVIQNFSYFPGNFGMKYNRQYFLLKTTHLLEQQ